MPETPLSSLPEQQPDNPIDRLKSPEVEIRKAAIAALIGAAPLTSQALSALEQAAANDPDQVVRQAALAALDMPPARRLRGGRAMPLAQRLEMLEQIERWRVLGLLNSDQASALRLRFTYDIAAQRLSPGAWNALYTQVGAWQEAGVIGTEQSASLLSNLQSMNQPAERLQTAHPAAPTQATPSAASVDANRSGTAAAGAFRPEAPPAGRQSLQQILFSEFSIRIALYLGGFLIVAAALILAAVLEFARLPILLGVTALTGAAALSIRARLPLPSFVLFIIFASLLPIDAGVAADLLKLEGSNTLNSYWAAVMTGEALLLAAATLLYRSRLFSLAALVSLDIAAIDLAARLGERIEYYLLLIMLVGLASAAWQVFLKSRAEMRLIWPLHWVTHLQSLPVLAGAGFTTLLYVLFTYDPSIGETVKTAHRLLLGATWLAAIAFYLVNDLRVKEFVLLPSLAAGAALFTPWILISALPVSAPLAALGVAFAGGLTALGSNRLALSLPAEQALRRYGAPLLAASAGMLLWAAVIGWVEDTPTAFGVLMAAGGLYCALHVQKARTGVWLAALLAWIAAYFTFFHLPFARIWDVDLAYQVCGAGLLLLLPDLLPLRSSQAGTHIERCWLVTARVLGVVMLTAATLGLALLWTADAADWYGDQTAAIDWQVAAWVFSVTGAFLLAYALRRARQVIYFAAGYLFAALACWLAYFEQSQLMLPLSALAAAFYLIGLGMLLSRRDAAWASVLRTSGLALSAALLLFLPNELQEKTGPGLALLLAGVLFLTEVHIRRGGWLEIPMLVLLGIAYTRLLRLFASGDALPGYDLLGASLIVLGFDLYAARSAWLAEKARNMQRLALRVLGGLLVGATALFWVLAGDLPARQPALVFLLYTVFFLLMAWGHRQPRLGYLMFSALAGSLFYAMRAAGFETWLAPEIVLAAALYAASFLVRRRLASPAWFEVLRLSGLLLAMLASFSAPLEDSGLAASLWVAAAATLYAIEAFRLRNVWLGFPANGLYLLAYFILLYELKVREPQYFSVGVAVLGLLMHYLLVRSGSRLGAFLTGLVSQFVLLGTTYIQMVSTNRLSFFVMLFFQGLAVLAYGLIIRSRSLVLAPVVFIVLGVITVVLSVLSGVPTAIIIGCTGVLLLAAGILALLMRERLVEFSDRFGGWRA